MLKATILLSTYIFMSLGLLLRSGVCDNKSEKSDSIFEQLITQNGGVVPYPFQNLASFLEQKLNGKGMTTAVLIPNSRSLQKDHTSDEHPRIVAAFVSNNQSFASPKQSFVNPKDMVFIGYSEDVAALEVISWNPSAENGKGRWEFQLVDDYSKGTKPKIRTPERSSCVLCHQGEAGIFTAAPWSEMTGIIGDPGHKTLIDKLLKKHPSGYYHGVEIRARLSAAFLNGRRPRCDGNLKESLPRWG